MKHPKYWFNYRTRMFLCVASVVATFLVERHQFTYCGWVYIVLMSIGSFLNLLVMGLNGGKMPIPSFTELREDMKITYVHRNKDTRLAWLADRILIAWETDESFKGAAYSIGDLFLYPALFSLCGYIIETIYRYGLFSLIW